VDICEYFREKAMPNKAKWWKTVIFSSAFGRYITKIFRYGQHHRVIYDIDMKRDLH